MDGVNKSWLCCNSSHALNVSVGAPGDKVSTCLTLQTEERGMKQRASTLNNTSGRQGYEFTPPLSVLPYTRDFSFHHKLAVASFNTHRITSHSAADAGRQLY